jgi:Fe-S-cluster containining protein
VTTTDEKPKKRTKRARLVILEVPSEDEWAPMARLPKPLVRVERSLNPCPTCPAHCCHGVVHATLVESARIALLLAMPMETFVRAVKIDRERPFEPSAELMLDVGPRRLAFQETNEAHRCTFLHDIGNRRRCSIHGLRPGICRQYPFKIQRGDLRVDVGTEALCPTKWLWNDDTLQTQAGYLDAWLVDRALDDDLAAKWNDDGAREGPRADRSLAALCRFAVEQVHGRLGIGDVEALYPRPRRKLGQL